MANVVHRTAYRVVKKIKAALHSSRQNSTEAILKSVYKKLNIPNFSTLNEFAWQNLDRWPDKTLAVCAVTGRGYTYAQAHKMSKSFAASLRIKLKLQNDDKVGIILPNIPEYPSVALGVLEAGCIASMMNHFYTVNELKHLLELANCKAVVTTKLSYANVIQALKEINLNIPIIMIDNEGVPEGAIKFAEFAEDIGIDTDCLKEVKRSSGDVAILPFSSGTTGYPKGVVLTHKSVVAVNKMIVEPEIIAVEESSASHQSVLPAVLPFFHIIGFNLLMINLMGRGAKLVTLPAFKPDLFLEAIVKYGAHHLYVVPPIALFLGKHPAVLPKHFETVKDVICGAAPISESDVAAILEKNKNLIFRQGYGLTETGGAISLGQKKDINHSAVGHIFNGTKLKIADLETQEALGPGKEGEIWFRGPNLMTGYYKNEAATKEVITEDGWYKTGDIGKYDENSYLYITDRLKELIKVKGFQVPPAELETILRTHPKVLDCAVLGISDPMSGEVPKAFVVSQSGQSVNSDEILEFVNNRVVAFKRLKEVQFVEAIPKNPAGKILRKHLKAKYC